MDVTSLPIPVPIPVPISAELPKEIFVGLTWWFWVSSASFLLLVALKILFKFIDAVRGE